MLHTREYLLDPTAVGDYEKAHRRIKVIHDRLVTAAAHQHAQRLATLVSLRLEAAQISYDRTESVDNLVLYMMVHLADMSIHHFLFCEPPDAAAASSSTNPELPRAKSQKLRDIICLLNSVEQMQMQDDNIFGKIRSLPPQGQRIIQGVIDEFGTPSMPILSIRFSSHIACAQGHKVYALKYPRGKQQQEYTPNPDNIIGLHITYGPARDANAKDLRFVSKVAEVVRRHLEPLLCRPVFETDRQVVAKLSECHQDLGLRVFSPAADWEAYHPYLKLSLESMADGTSITEVRLQMWHLAVSELSRLFVKAPFLFSYIPPWTPYELRDVHHCMQAAELNDTVQKTHASIRDSLEGHATRVCTDLSGSYPYNHANAAKLLTILFECIKQGDLLHINQCMSEDECNFDANSEQAEQIALFHEYFLRRRQVKPIGAHDFCFSYLDFLSSRRRIKGVQAQRNRDLLELQHCLQSYTRKDAHDVFQIKYIEQAEPYKDALQLTYESGRLAFHALDALGVPELMHNYDGYLLGEDELIEALKQAGAGFVDVKTMRGNIDFLPKQMLLEGGKFVFNDENLDKPGFYRCSDGARIRELQKYMSRQHSVEDEQNLLTDVRVLLTRGRCARFVLAWFASLAEQVGEEGAKRLAHVFGAPIGLVVHPHGSLFIPAILARLDADVAANILHSLIHGQRLHQCVQPSNWGNMKGIRLKQKCPTCGRGIYLNETLRMWQGTYAANCDVMANIAVSRDRASNAKEGRLYIRHAICEMHASELKKVKKS